MSESLKNFEASIRSEIRELRDQLDGKTLTSKLQQQLDETNGKIQESLEQNTTHTRRLSSNIETLQASITSALHKVSSSFRKFVL